MTAQGGVEEYPIPIYVLIGNISGVLAQVVKVLIQQQADMVLIGEKKHPVELLLAAKDGADIVILSATYSYPPPGICSQLLSECPALKILVLATGEDVGMAYWLGLRWQKLYTPSVETLADSIRDIYKLDPTA